MGLEFLSYKRFEVGKMISSSKLMHVWKYKYYQRNYELKVWESKLSGKFKVMFQKKVIFSTVLQKKKLRGGILIQYSDFVFTFKLQGDKLACFINLEEFVPYTIVGQDNSLTED